MGVVEKYYLLFRGKVLKRNVDPYYHDVVVQMMCMIKSEMEESI